MRLTLGLLLSGLVVGCHSAESPGPRPDGGKPPANAALARWVAPRSVEGAVLFEAPAVLLAPPDASAIVGLSLPATVTRVLVRPGDQVVAKQPVLEVLMPQAVVAAGQLVAARVRLTAHEHRLAQLEALKAEGLARSAELAEVTAAAASAKAELQAARAIVRVAGLDDARASALLEGTGTFTLTAPMAAVVTAVHVQPGEPREPAGGALVELSTAALGRVEARLPSAPPPGARFFFVSGPGREVECALERLAPRVERRDGATLAWLTPNAPVPAGLTGRVLVRSSGGERLAAVPVRALVARGEQMVVATLHGGEVRWVGVEVKARSGAEAVVAGLPDESRVAADGASMEAQP